MVTNRSTGAIEISIALAENARTRPIIDGRVVPQGIHLLPTVIHGSEIFWRQLKYGDFDVSEMSMSSLLIAHARGDRRWVGLPIYAMRRFFHTDILVRRGAGVAAPTDLKGKRVGVPEYQQTSAIWSRGILEHEFGVRATDIDWFMERGPERSHGGATGFTPPPGVRLSQIPAHTNIGEMLMRGELDATLLYLSDPNLVDRSRADVSSVTTPLFPDRAAEGRRYYAMTSLYPINHAMVIRRSLLERHPWAALNIYAAFAEAKTRLAADARAMVQGYLDIGLLGADAAKVLDSDPMAYGFKAARPVLETVARYVHEQGLSEHVVPIEQLFAESTLAL
jgi:4,5-dihydroxyphthalate decarboxylase